MRSKFTSPQRKQGRESPLLALRAGVQSIPIVVETVQFPSGPYLLEGELAYANPPFLSPASGSEEGGIRGGVVLAGSHPLLGGNMHNNVVRGLGDALAEHGWATLRFNYRGVGRSEGPRVDVAAHMAEFWKTSHVEGEMDLWQDVQSAAAYLRPIIGPDWPLVLIGYSFGCALLPPLCRTEAPAAVVLIAPPLGKHDISSFPSSAWERTSGSSASRLYCGQTRSRASQPCVPKQSLGTRVIPCVPKQSLGTRTIPCVPKQSLGTRAILVIVSTDDFTLEPARLHAWFDGLPEPKRLVQAAADNHFFRGHELWLVETVSAFLSEQVR